MRVSRNCTLAICTGNYMRNTFLNAASFVAIAAFGAVSAAAETSAAVEGETEFDEDTPVIVVTGGKTEQSLQDVTASVNVTTAETIEREPITDLFDIIERVPNVTASFGEQGFAIRGIDQRGVGGSGATLIVIGAHRPDLKDYLLGPHAARVVRHAECSVLVVRAG